MDALDRERLRDVPIFATLTGEQLDALTPLLREESYPRGRSVVREGDIGYDFYVIASGEAEVTHDAQILRTLSAGDFFGEIGIASSDGKRTATVTARTDLEVWTMYGTVVQRLQAEHPEIATALASATQHRRDGS